MTTYNWKGTAYNFLPNQSVNASDIFSLVIIWKIADTAVERGFIQLVSDGPGTNPLPSPDEIRDFTMIATSLDGQKTFRWNKSDLPIHFIRPHNWSEAYDTNLQLTEDRLFLGDTRLSADGYVFHQTDAGTYEITLPNKTIPSYAISGRWT